VTSSWFLIPQRDQCYFIT